MKTAFFRKYISTVCAAALMAGVSASPAFAASSIEINLDVLEKSSKPAVAATPAKKEEAKSAPAKKAAEKPKAAAPKKAEQKKAEPKKAEAKPVEHKPAEHKAPAHGKETPAPAPAVAPVPAPAAAVPPAPAELPPIKDLPGELAPTPPEASIPPAEPIKELPAPAVPAESKAPELPKPAVPAETKAPELPKPDATAPLPKPTPVEPPKPGLGDQLSDFISGKPSTAPTPPALPPGEPAAPKTEVTPPPLPNPGGPIPAAPNLMGSPLPDSSLKSDTPPAAPATKPAEHAAAPAVPAAAAIPPEPKEPEAPMAVGTPMALPTLTPAPPPSEKKPETAPELPEPVKDATPPALPEAAPTGLPEPAKPALPPVSEALTPKKPELALPDSSDKIAVPSKTAEIPDLVPLPDDAKGDLPSLPSGNQEDLLSASPKNNTGANKALMDELSKKGSSSDPDMRLIFSESETDVSQALYGQLDTVAAKLEQSPNTRVNILSYAGGKNESGIYPKRVSLARGIAVRNYLTTTKGIDIERVNVRALGNKSEGAAPDRVDVFLVK